MSLALTTTNENTAIFRGVAMSRGTPRRMKMTCRCPATQKKARLPPKRLVARSFFTWCRAPVEELDPDIRRHPPLSPASARKQSTQRRLSPEGYPTSLPLMRCVMDVVFPHCAGLDVHKKRITACRVSPDPTGQDADGVLEVQDFGTLTMNLAPSGRTVLLSDVLGASPTASSHLQVCQH
jgi:hypothetical protein